MLLEAGLIDQFQLDSALSMQRNLGGRIGSALVKLGYLPEETILEFLETQAKYSRVSLRERVIAEELMNLLSLQRMLEWMVVPIELRKNIHEKLLRVAMTDPTNLKLIDDLQFTTGCKIIPVLAAEEEIRQAIKNSAAAEEPAASEVQAESRAIEHEGVHFEEIAGHDPRLDVLLDMLKQKGLLSALDVERVKFN